MNANSFKNEEPPIRKAKSEILHQSDLFQNSMLEEILNSLPNIGFIVNKERQIVFANQILLDMLGMRNLDEMLGARLGEILQCVNSQNYIHGCGTGEACRYCGCVQVVLESQKLQSRVSGECRKNSIFESDLVSFNLSITAQPLVINKEQFIRYLFWTLAIKKEKSY